MSQVDGDRVEEEREGEKYDRITVDPEGRPLEKTARITRAPRPNRRRNAYEKQALLVSIAAFVAAFLGSIFTGYQALYTQFSYDSEGPVLQTYPSLVTWVDNENSTSVPVDSKHPASIVSLLPPGHHAAIFLRFQNVGREATTLVDVIFDVSPAGLTPASVPTSDGSIINFCSKSGYAQRLQPPPADCAATLPYTIQPGDIYTVTLSLDQYLPGMATYAPNDFKARIDAVGVSGSPLTEDIPLKVTT